MMKFNNEEKIKKQLIKKGAVIGAAGLLLLAGGSMTVMAADTVSGTLNGYSCSGRVEKNRDEAIAITAYARGNSSIEATALVYYKFGFKNYYSDTTATNTAGGATAVAVKKLGGADVHGGKGMHYIVSGLYSWMPRATVTGTILPNAEKI